MPWRTLSPRKILLGPLKAFASALLPVGIALVSLSDLVLTIVVVVLGVVSGTLAGLVPYLTTRYRITATHFEVRTGWLNKKVSTAALTRIRSVDLQASLPYRVLAMSKLTAGTGVDAEQVELDALPTHEAQALQRWLLTRRTAGLQVSADTSEAFDAAPPHPSAAVLEVAAWTPEWARFAPAHLTGFVVLAAVGGIVGFLAQLPGVDEAEVERAWDWVNQFAGLSIALALVAFALVGWLVVAFGTYVTEWFGFRLWREAGSLHLSRGLLTTRSLSLEEQRIRGVEVSEPMVVRVLGGADLRVRSSGEGNTNAQVLPTAPRATVLDVATAILNDAAPLWVSAVQHPAAARRRRVWRGLAPAIVLGMVGVLARMGWVPGEVGDWLETNVTWGALLVALTMAAGWGVLAGLLAYHHLGHALTDRHLVRTGGIFTRRREVLELDGVIGWVISQTVFQRRMGLATLTATTAVGTGKLVIPDLAVAETHALMAAATPLPLAPFLR